MSNFIYRWFSSFGSYRFHSIPGILRSVKKSSAITDKKDVSRFMTDLQTQAQMPESEPESSPGF
ncbi:MAG: hypothetical protein ACYC2P_10985 [Paludibacteraceae bacterium]